MREKNLEKSVFISNDFEVLREKLFQNLQGNLFPLKKIIVTPSPLLESEFVQGIKQNSSVCGFKVLQLHSAIDYLLRLLKLDEKFKFKLPTPTVLAFHIECIIRKMLQDEKALGSFEFLKPLFDFFTDSHQLLLNKRIKELSYELSKQFQVLGSYGSSELEQFLSKESWQKYIWDKVHTHWSYLYLLEKIEDIPNELSVEASFHFFGFTHIPKVIDRFFFKLPSGFDLRYYFLSPSLFYYGDTLSDKKKYKITNQALLEEHSKNPSPLVSNWGSLFSDRQNFLVDHLLDVDEKYFDPITKSYTDFELVETETSSTLLNHLKRDLLYMNFTDKITVCQESDDSFQVHASKTKYREVENLKTVLLNLIENKGLQPKDISIYAPDISKYYPYLKMIFEGESPELQLHIEGLDYISQSCFLKALTDLFALRLTKFSKVDVMNLFHYSAIRDAVGLSQEDISYIDTLCEKAQIRFGFDKKHKERLLSKFSDSTFVGSDAGSWDYGLKRLVFGLCMCLDEGVEEIGSDRFYPIEGLDYTRCNVFGRFIQYIYDLFDDLEAFSSLKLSLEDWCDRIKVFSEKYLNVQNEESEAYFFLLDQLKVLSNLSIYLEGQKLSFSSVESYLHKAFSKKVAKNDAQINKVFISSLSMGCMKSTKAICLLGMDEAFPRVEKQIKLMSLEKKQLDFFPISQEVDRHLLLESILLAKEFYIVSYTSLSQEDGKEVPISTAVEELLSILDEYYEIGSKKVSEARVFKQKLLSFDHQYFSKDHPYQLYSKGLYTKAEEYYLNDKRDNPFIEELYTQTDISKIDHQDEIIPVYQLKQLLSNPLGFYFKYGLRVNLSEKLAEKDLYEQELFIAPLEKYLLKKDMHFHRQSDVLQRASKKGIIPDGIYKDLACLEFGEYEKDLMSICESYQLNIHDFWVFKLSFEIEKPHIDESVKVVYVPSPEITVNGRKIRFSGELTTVTKKGLFFHGKDDFTDLLKIWAEYLLYILIFKPAEFSNELLVGKSLSVKSLPKEEAEVGLKLFIEYYFQSLKHPSPMFPSAAKAILCGSEQEIEKEISKIFNNQTNFLDPYTKWCVDHMKPFCGHAISKNWSEILKKSFTPLIEWQKK